MSRKYYTYISFFTFILTSCASQVERVVNDGVSLYYGLIELIKWAVFIGFLIWFFGGLIGLFFNKRKDDD
jgi:hypothetical protein